MLRLRSPSVVNYCNNAPAPAIENVVGVLSHPCLLDQRGQDEAGLDVERSEKEADLYLLWSPQPCP